MTIQELRFGNMVNCVEDKSGPVSQIKSGRVNVMVKGSYDKTVEYSYGYDEISGIPLTPEWLERAGFYLNTGHMFLEVKYNRGLSIDGIHVRLHDESGSKFLCNIEHLHQLQNLYYCLTGEELTIK